MSKRIPSWIVQLAIAALVVCGVVSVEWCLSGCGGEAFTADAGAPLEALAVDDAGSRAAGDAAVPPPGVDAADPLELDAAHALLEDARPGVDVVAQVDAAADAPELLEDAGPDVIKVAQACTSPASCPSCGPYPRTPCCTASSVCGCEVLQGQCIP